MNCYLQLAIFSACLGLFQLGYNGSGLNQVESKIEKFLYETFKERYGIQLTTESTSTYFSFAVAIFEFGGMVCRLSRFRALVLEQIPFKSFCRHFFASYEMYDGL